MIERTRTLYDDVAADSERRRMRQES
jgi:hypothetical protein